MSFLLVVLIGNQIADIAGQGGIDICDYLNSTVVANYLNDESNGVLYFAPDPGPGIYFALIPSVSIYEEGDRITGRIIHLNCTSKLRPILRSELKKLTSLKFCLC